MLLNFRHRNEDTDIPKVTHSFGLQLALHFCFNGSSVELLNIKRAFQCGIR